MKLRLLSIGMLISLGVAAQDDQFGLKAGLNIAKFDAGGVPLSPISGQGYSPFIGYHAGIFFRNNYEKMAVQTEILYSVQGTKSNSGASNSAELRLSYISIPILFKYNVVSKLNLQAGPQVSTLLNNKVKTSLDDAQNSFPTSSFNSIDLSMSLGCGWDFSNSLTVDCRYNIGLSKVFRNNGDPSIPDIGPKSRVFMISMGWNFLK